MKKKGKDDLNLRLQLLFCLTMELVLQKDNTGAWERVE